MTTQTLRAGSSTISTTLPIGSILFVAILLLSWVSVNPFASLDDAKLIALGDTSDLINQLAYVTLAGSVVVYLLMQDGHRLRPGFHPVYFAMVAWLAVSVATSTHPELSIRRVVFAVLAIVLAAALPLLPATLRQFCDLTAGVVITVLFLCYAGVVLAPQVAIHQASDVVEPTLAGNWRGLFAHKNIAGPMMVNFIFVGLFVAKMRSAVLGWSIAAAAAIFFAFCEAKAATGLLPLVLLLSWTIERLQSPISCTALVIGVLIGLHLLTVGSLYFDSINWINDATLTDPTFTGRRDIWQFAIDNIVERPWLGYGFGSFWQTPETVFNTLVVDTQSMFSASHAHNGFLELALTLGIPGVVIAIFWILVLPLRDLQHCKIAQCHPELTRLFVRMWLFGLYTTAFESVLFARGDPHWFVMLLAMFGLRYLSVFRLGSK